MLVAAITITAGIATFCVGPAWPVTLLGATLAGLGGASAGRRDARSHQ